MENNSDSYDLIVIGGGAAGFFTAIQTGEASYGAARILLLEKASKTLGKVKISGGGRCNVTHSCFDPKALTKHYPRGEKSLIGPFHHFQPTDMIEWLKDKGVELKTEADGRMFPTTDNSQTIIDCLTNAATEVGTEIKKSTEVISITPATSSRYQITTKAGETYFANHIMIATGGTRLKSSAMLAESLGHDLIPPVPSLFTFNIDDNRLKGIEGLSVQQAQTSVPNHKLSADGPILVTHWGLSGPAILKLSAWGARSLSECDYTFPLFVNWAPQADAAATIAQQRSEHGKRFVAKRSPIESLPRRLWEKLVEAANIDTSHTWSQINKQHIDALIEQIHRCPFQANGKSINKDEFVTCGGIPLKQIRTKTFESKLAEGIYFAGEVLDIDGITGGFNFQNAWTSSHLASQAIAQAVLNQEEE